MATYQAILNFRKETVEELMATGRLVPQGDFVRLLAFKGVDVEALGQHQLMTLANIEEDLGRQKCSLEKGYAIVAESSCHSIRSWERGSSRIAVS